MEEIKNPVFELRLELEAINENLNEFWEFYEFLTTANTITKRYFEDLFIEFSNGNFINAKTCLQKLIERLSKEAEDPIHSYVKNMFDSAIKVMVNANGLCDKAIELIENSAYQGMNEKQIIKAKKKDLDLQLAEKQEKHAPYLNLSLSIVFILMSVIFVFIPDYFNNPTLLYHICGFMFFFGFLFAKQEIELRNKFGFVTQSEKLTTKRAFISLVQAVVYMIPLAVLSIFFYELLFIRILFIFFTVIYCLSKLWYAKEIPIFY